MIESQNKKCLIVGLVIAGFSAPLMTNPFLAFFGFSLHLIGITLLMLYLLMVNNRQIQVNQLRTTLLWAGCGSLFIAEFQIASKCSSLFFQIKKGKDELIWHMSDLSLPFLFSALALGLLSTAVKKGNHEAGEQTFEIYYWIIGLFLGTVILTFLYGQLGLLAYTS